MQGKRAFKSGNLTTNHLQNMQGTLYSLMGTFYTVPTILLFYKIFLRIIGKTQG